MSNEIDIFKCLDYIKKNAGEYAKAKAERQYIDQYRKSKKALLMNEKTGPGHERESYAYAHPEYLTLLDGYKVAVETEERLKWLLDCAKLKAEAWRTIEANNRFIDKVHT